MKRLMFWMFALLLAGNIACSDSNTEEPAPNPGNGPEEPVEPEDPKSDLTFEIELLSVGAVTVDVLVKPSISDVRYYTDVINEEGYRQIMEDDGGDIDVYLQWQLNRLVEEYGMTFDGAIRAISSAGEYGYLLGSLKPESVYYAFAVGFDEDGYSTSEVEWVRFETKAKEMSDNEISIEVTGTGEGYADVSVTATVEEDPYLLCIIPKNISRDMTEDQIIGWVISENSSMFAGGLEAITHYGNYTGREGEAKPGWEYEVVAFGYKDYYATTAVTRVTAKLGEGGDPANCTFQKSIRFDDFTMNISFTPSDNNVVYICDAIKEDYLQDIMASFNCTIEEALLKNLEAMYQTHLPSYPNLGGVVNLVTTNGRINWEVRYEPERTYRLWAVAVNQDGTPAGAFDYSEPVTAPKYEISDVANLTLTGWQYYRGTDLNALYPDLVPNNMKIYAYVAWEVEPSDGSVEWWSYVYNANLTDYLRPTLIANLLNAPTEPNATVQLAACYYGEATIWGVAKDAEGLYGPIMIQVVDLDKEKAAEVPTDLVPEETTVRPLYRNYVERPEANFKPEDGFISNRYK